MQMPGEMGPVHILGIGGIGMSAIAEILHAKGYTVQGSDQKDSANVKRLRAKGIRVFVGHDAVNLVGARYIVVSTAIKPSNPELEAARAKGYPIIRRAEMLAELMRLYATVSVTGTHGKTTTTSLIAHLFNAAGLDPTVITGGIINEWGSNARLGNGKWMIVEADESDGTFIKIPSQIGVVTNIDPEHLDYFKTVENMHREFEIFYRNIPFYGLAVACIDHPVVAGMIERLELRRDGRRLLTYGTTSGADLVLKSARVEGAQTYFDADLGARMRGGARSLRGWSVPLPGHHNALNALAAIAAASEAGIGDDVIRKALAGFSGVKRRFQPTGTWNGVTIYDDYGHHPVEIAAVLKAAKAGARGRVIAVVEPHRYTRVRDLFREFAACFKDADSVIVTPLYSAGELPIDGIDHAALAEAIRADGHGAVATVDSEREIAPALKRLAAPGDMVVCLGAGNSTEWAHALPDWLAGEPLRAGGTRHELSPICCPRWRRGCRTCAGGVVGQCHAGGHHLVSRRRAGAGAVHAGRCGRSRLFSRSPSGAPSRRRHRARLQLAGARRRRAGRGHSPRARLLANCRGAGKSHPHRHGRARREARACGGGRRDRWACLLPRRAGIGRRSVAHECRRAWPRDQGRAGRGQRRRPAGHHSHSAAGGDGADLPPLRRPRRLDLHRGAVPGRPGRAGRDPQADAGGGRVSRGQSADQGAHRRLHLQESAGLERLEADRCGRLPRPARRRRQGLRDALQLPDQRPQCVRRGHRAAGRDGARAGAGGVRRDARLGDHPARLPKDGRPTGEALAETLAVR